MSTARDPTTHGLSEPPTSRHGFTLIELLVVIAILVILAGLVVGALAGAQFRSRVTACSNNYRQWGIAVNLYATDDALGRLPAFPLPLGKFKSYKGLNPWFVAIDMGTNMARFGVTTPLWYCPARPRGFQMDQDQFNYKFPGRRITTMEDLTEYWKTEGEWFAVIEHSWFVPRPLEGTTEVYPDPKLLKSRSPDGWPTRLDDPTGSVQPILTDAVIGSWNDNKTEFEIRGTGHELPRFFTRNINLLFVDGHVETRSKKSLVWQIDSGGWALIPY